MKQNIKQENQITWIAVDWGTTRLRAYGMSACGKPVAESSSDAGIQRLSKSGFEPALLALIEAWLPVDGKIPVLACGMVGAKQGWEEADYRTLPCPPLSIDHLTRVITSESRIEVLIIAGLSQAMPADVMRGEETQISGLLAGKNIDSAIICLPGTHSKWARIENRELVEFSTHMTGELFALMSEQSILRHSVASTVWDEDAFLKGVKVGFETPERVLNAGFNLRARDILNNLDAGSARSRLSGLLIGMELAAARYYWKNNAVFLIGAARLIERYASALTSVGVRCQSLDSKSMSLAGLIDIYRQLYQSEVPICHEI